MAGTLQAMPKQATTTRETPRKTAQPRAATGKACTRTAVGDAAAVADAATANHVPTLGADAQGRMQARFLYFQGWRCKQIAEKLELPPSTVYGWKDAEKWDEATPLERVNGAIEVRMVQLVLKEEKTGGDFKEIDLLGRQLERTARVERYQSTGNEVHLNPNIASRNAAPKRPPKRNHFTEEQIEKLLDIFHSENFAYANRWWQAQTERTRLLLKSRQIGATWYFAREALIRAVTEGRNQIFLSASKAQAHQFKTYMLNFAGLVGVELSGDPIVLSNGAELHFLGTNAKTAQGRSGDFYFDEFFWVSGFRMLNKVAAAMATHKHWRKTYFSTPSAMSHEAYPFWNGTERNKGRAKADALHIDVTHDALHGGIRCADRKWRDIVNIEDASRLGCDLFDIGELREESSAEEFANLYMCEFIDDSASLFTLKEMQGCMVDSWEAWLEDVKPLAQRPYAYFPVWVGYDPSHTGDAAALVVIAPPRTPGGKFRLLHRQQFKGADYEAQAEAIRQITQQYNVVHIGIDTTGLGQGVYQHVVKFFPNARAYQYSVEVKSRLVLKAKQVIGKGRFEMDSSCTDVAAAFMAIRKVLTASQRQITYTAGRSDEAGHADLAWACMHAFDFETLAGDVIGGNSSMEIF